MTKKNSKFSKNQRERELLEAIKCSDINKIKELLAQDRSLLDVKFKLKKTLAEVSLLGCACFYADQKTIEYVMSLQQDQLQDQKDSKGRSPLHFAAAGGRVDIVEWLIKEYGFDPKVKTVTGLTVLHYAAMSGDIGMIEYSIGEGLHPKEKTSTGLTSIHYAAMGFSIEAIKYLAECGVNVKDLTDDKRSVLHYATWCYEADSNITWSDSNSAKLTEFLIKEYLFDPNAQNAGGNNALSFLEKKEDREKVAKMFNVQSFIRSIDLAKTEEIKRLLKLDPSLINEKVLVEKLGYKVNSLEYAAVNGNKEVLEYLIDFTKGFPDKKKNLCHYAAFAGKTDITKWLIDVYKLDPKAKIGLDRENAFHYAVRSGDSSAIDFLVTTIGLDPKEKTGFGKSALHIAASYYEPQDIQNLIDKYDLDPKAKDDSERTMLHYAAIAQNMEVIRYCIETLHLKPEDKDNQGKTALSCMTLKNQEEISCFIKELKQKEKQQAAWEIEELERAVELDIEQEQGKRDSTRLADISITVVNQTINSKQLDIVTEKQDVTNTSAISFLEISDLSERDTTDSNGIEREGHGDGVLNVSDIEKTENNDIDLGQGYNILNFRKRKRLHDDERDDREDDSLQVSVSFSLDYTTENAKDQSKAGEEKSEDADNPKSPEKSDQDEAQKVKEERLTIEVAVHDKQNLDQAGGSSVTKVQEETICNSAIKNTDSIGSSKISDQDRKSEKAKPDPKIKNPSSNVPRINFRVLGLIMIPLTICIAFLLRNQISNNFKIPNIVDRSFADIKPMSGIYKFISQGISK